MSNFKSFFDLTKKKLDEYKEKLSSNKETNRSYQYRVVQRAARDIWLSMSNNTKQLKQYMDSLVNREELEYQLIRMHLLIRYFSSLTNPKKEEILEAFSKVTQWRVLDQASKLLIENMLFVPEDIDYLLKKLPFIPPQLQRVILTMISLWILKNKIASRNITILLDLLLKNQIVMDQLNEKGIQRVLDAIMEKEPEKIKAVYYSMNKDIPLKLRNYIKKLIEGENKSKGITTNDDSKDSN